MVGSHRRMGGEVEPELGQDPQDPQGRPLGASEDPHRQLARPAQGGARELARAPPDFAPRAVAARHSPPMLTCRRPHLHRRRRRLVEQLALDRPDAPGRRSVAAFLLGFGLVIFVIVMILIFILFVDLLQKVVHHAG